MKKRNQGFVFKIHNRVYIRFLPLMHEIEVKRRDLKYDEAFEEDQPKIWKHANRAEEIESVLEMPPCIFEKTHVETLEEMWD